MPSGSRIYDLHVIVPDSGLVMLAYGTKRHADPSFCDSSAAQVPDRKSVKECIRQHATVQAKCYLSLVQV